MNDKIDLYIILTQNVRADENQLSIPPAVLTRLLVGKTYIIKYIERLV